MYTQLSMASDLPKDEEIEKLAGCCLVTPALSLTFSGPESDLCLAVGNKCPSVAEGHLWAVWSGHVSLSPEPRDKQMLGVGQWGQVCSLVSPPHGSAHLDGLSWSLP